MLDDLWIANLGLRRRYPQGVAPLQMIARLAEECGELSAEVQRWENVGTKRAKLGEPDREALAKEVMDVMRAALAVAEYYGVEAELGAALKRSIAASLRDGLISDAEAASAGPAER
jgi:NTP pyrophosphatase (non-canonical NTP hydrolase)